MYFVVCLVLVLGFFLRYSFSLTALFIMQLCPLETRQNNQIWSYTQCNSSVTGFIVWSIHSSSGWLNVWTEMTVWNNSLVEFLHIQDFFWRWIYSRLWVFWSTQTVVQLYSWMYSNFLITIYLLEGPASKYN